jgi:purine-nucleoside phosphorylase
MIEKQLAETKEFLSKRTRLRPKLGFVLGSGLSGFGKQVQVDTEIPFAEIPHFAVSSVDGHPGKLLIGTVGGVSVAVMMGRLHAYEGLTLQQVVFPVRALAALGVNTLLVTNASGGLSEKMRPGDFMVIRDHINLTGDNPLRGPNVAIGPRFVDMSEPYDKTLAKFLHESLRKEKVRAHNGVYVGVLGPSYETASEIKYFAKLGGGAVGMSTVAEVIAARHAGIRVAGLSCITNLGTGLSKKPLKHEEVKEVAHQVEVRFTRTLLTFTAKLKNHL